MTVISVGALSHVGEAPFTAIGDAFGIGGHEHLVVQQYVAFATLQISAIGEAIFISVTSLTIRLVSKAGTLAWTTYQARRTRAEVVSYVR